MDLSPGTRRVPFNGVTVGLLENTNLELIWSSILFFIYSFKITAINPHRELAIGQ
jgi:hypothetical protein